MKRLLYICLVAGALVAAGCRRTLPVAPPYEGLAGTYSYTAYDSSGIAVVSGWLELAPKDSVQFTGEWHFKEVAKSHPVGPQIGDGELIGGIDGDAMWISLNPQWRDNNVFLNGTLEGTTYSGQWVWSTFAGPTTGGEFTAMKKSE